MTLKEDIKKVSVKPDHRKFMQEVVEEGYFDLPVDFFNFCVAYAISKNYKVSKKELELSRPTNLDDWDRLKFNDILDVIRGVYVDESIRELVPVRIMNALADKAIEDILENHWDPELKELKLEKILVNG